MTTIDLADIQGILYRFYTLPVSRHLMFHFNNAVAGKRFLSTLLPQVTSARASENSQASRFLNLGLTAKGLTALDVDETVLSQFPDEFRSLPDPASLGDYPITETDTSWHGKVQTEKIHCIVHLFGNFVPQLDDWTREIRAQAGPDVEELIPTADGQPLDGGYLSTRRLHFDYKDGISQPDIAWSDEPADPTRVDAPLNFRHFVLGYSTPQITSSPPMWPSQALSAKAATDLATNGSYMVFRWIYQDVAGFNKFLEDQGPKVAPGASQADAQELVAAKLVGRWRDGTPLVLSPGRPQESLRDRNDFKYLGPDPTGKLCPHSAHIRVTNPRDQKLGPNEPDSVPRVIRRGTPFGTRLEGTRDDGRERGLIGMFLCTSIADQFLRLMSWMRRNDFSPVFDGHVTDQDPLANRNFPGASQDFRIPSDAGTTTIQLQNFTRTLGTAYLLLPGLSGLRRIAS
jgi:hypothetical protein